MAEGDGGAGGASPILLAIHHGHTNLVPLFLDAGAALDFHEAYAYGDADRVRALLESEPSLLEERGSDGHTALGLAIFFGHDAIARMLMDRGADVNAASRNAQRVAPLHAAVARRNAGMVRDLLARGADANAGQAGGFTPLHSAAFHGDHEIAEALLAAGADPRKTTAQGKTAADLAHEQGHSEIAAWLAGKA